MNQVKNMVEKEASISNNLMIIKKEDFVLYMILS
jgi:hypothetical protein